MLNGLNFGQFVYGDGEFRFGGGIGVFRYEEG